MASPCDEHHPRFQADFEASYRRVLSVYEELGYPRALVQMWAMPERDASLLARACARLAPLRVLEVGTYVGVSTMILALFTPPGARIHTVDPGLPLGVEHTAMECDGLGADLAVTTTALARRAAQRLGLAHKIVFHTGGFSRTATFAGPDTAAGEPVGPMVCREHGPFDFALIDGLHYADAVQSDLSLAQGSMTPRGVMALHDLIGRWGSQVRAGASLFLERFTNWRLEHPDYADLYWSLGFFRQEPDPVLPGYPSPRTGLLGPGLLRHLAEALAALYPGASLAVAGGPPGMPALLRAAGLTDLTVLGPGPHAPDRADTAPISPNELDAGGRRFDLILCLGELERLSPGEDLAALAALTRASDRIVFAVSPPGERGGSVPGQRPAAWWTARFRELGFVVRDPLRPLLEPFAFASGPKDKRAETSDCANLLVAEKPASPLTPEHWFDLCQEKERRIESLVLQQVGLANMYWDQVWRREAYEGYLRAAESEIAGLKRRLADLGAPGAGAKE